MNSLERVLSTLKGETLDRPAVSLTLPLYGARLIRCPLKEYYTNPKYYAEGQYAIKEEIQPDILFSPFALTAEGEAFGSEVIYYNNQAPNLIRFAAQSAEEMLNLNYPDINKHPRLTYIRESIRILSSKYKNEVPIAGIVLSPVDLPIMIIGIEAWLEALLFQEKIARQVLEICSNFFIEWSNAIAADGATTVIFPGVFCNPRVISPKIVQEIIIPVFERVFSEVKCPIVLHHGGDIIGPFLEMYKNLPNVIAFLVDKNDNLAESRKKIGPNKLLLGNIDGPTLNKLKPDDIKIKCSGILENRKDDKHFILASSAADIPYDTPKENLMAVMEAINEFRLEK
jgi:uroporphyrinogen decarboxylase